MQINEENASFRFEYIYESIREALQSFMAFKGYKPYSHKAVILFSEENGLINELESRTIDRYRQIRNDISYRAQKTDILDVKEALAFAESLIPRLMSKAKF